ncbi:MAG: hypothetical protein M3121_01045, partial [Chloroflexota bacterium]|nr:hypothetical protein [Chloroflexota bacterium]
LDDDAFIIIAGADTLTTNTILRTLDTQRDFTFLSNALTLIAPGGMVLPFPKPLAIDRRALVDVKTPLLSFRERIMLVIPSRVYPKPGRLIHLFRANARLVRAMTSAVGHWWVPRHPYFVTELMPHARIAPRVRLAGMVVFEQGADEVVHLQPNDVLQTLVAPYEQLVGVPVHEEIDDFLYQTGKNDPRLVERQIVAAAMQGRSSVLLRSESGEWHRMLSEFIDGAIQARSFEWDQPTAAELAVLEETALS